MASSDQTICRGRFTPQLLILALLAIECVLWMSERFRWFEFNTQKGWTVLRCFYIVLVVAAVLASWFATSLLLRKRFQFTIRSLLLLMVAVALPLGWFNSERTRAREQQEVVTRIESLGGCVQADWKFDQIHALIPTLALQEKANPTEPEWLRNLLGKDFFTAIRKVTLSGDKMTDDELDHLTVLADLESLSIFGSKVTDAGLAKVTRFRQLELLQIESSELTDAGLVRLGSMRHLRLVFVRGARLTDAGLAKLRQSLPQCEVIR